MANVNNFIYFFYKNLEILKNKNTYQKSIQ